MKVQDLNLVETNDGYRRHRSQRTELGDEVSVQVSPPNGTTSRVLISISGARLCVSTHGEGATLQMAIDEAERVLRSVVSAVVWDTYLSAVHVPAEQVAA